MTDFEQHDREQRQLMVEFLLEAVRYLAQISTPVQLARHSLEIVVAP
jgi:hypothetical protein